MYVIAYETQVLLQNSGAFFDHLLSPYFRGNSLRRAFVRPKAHSEAREQNNNLHHGGINTFDGGRLIDEYVREQ